MFRAALLALVVVSLLGNAVEAQRAGGGSHAGGSGMGHFQGGASGSGFAGRGAYRAGRGSYFSPYFLPDESYGAEGSATEPFPRIIYSPPDPEKPPVQAQVIELPGNSSSKDSKTSQPAMFILISGERLESPRFLLTASSLSVSVNRRQRIIPMDAIDLDATVAANRERGIDLHIPSDRSEISLSF